MMEGANKATQAYGYTQTLDTSAQINPLCISVTLPVTSRISTTVGTEQDAGLNHSVPEKCKFFSTLHF